MTKSGLSKSIRKFIRIEKARIRAMILDARKQEEMIEKLYNRFIANKTDDKIFVDNQIIESNLNSKSKVQISNQVQGLKSKIGAKQSKIKKQKLKAKK